MKNEHLHSALYFCIPKSHKKSIDIVTFRFDDILNEGVVEIENADSTSIFNPDMVFKFPKMQGFKETFDFYNKIIKEVKDAQLNDSGCPTNAARQVAEGYAQ